MLRNILFNKFSLNLTLNCSQKRLTHVLKRKVRPIYGQRLINPFIVGPFLVERRLQREPRPVADYIYDVVEDTDSRPVGNIKVILLKHVEELGVPGDVVYVDADQARFQLILSKAADYASPYNMNKYRDLIAKGAQFRDGPSSAFVMSTVRRLAHKVILIEMNSNTDWVIDKLHVRIALRKAGFVVPIDAIELPKTAITGHDIPGKEGKDFAIYLTINGKERVAVRCMVHHFGQILSQNWFRAPRFVLLPEEQTQLLSSMPVQERVDDDKDAEEEFVS